MSFELQMITLIITLASIIAYLTIGYRAALRNLPRAWAEARKQWGSWNAEASVKGRTICMFLFWLFYIPGRAIGDQFNRVIRDADPQVAATKIKDHQERIRELERELGMRR